MQKRKFLLAPLALAVAGLFACNPDRQDEEDTTPPDPQADSAAAGERVTRLVEAYYEENLE
ncbi:MAG: hypothetical protein ACREIV_15550, partial [Planctomycetaceae bacterium]